MKRSAHRVNGGATRHPAQRNKAQRLEESPAADVSADSTPRRSLATASRAVALMSAASSARQPPAPAPSSPHELFAYCKQLILAGEQQQALIALRKALRANPGSLELTLFTAYAFHRCQHYKQAMAAFEQADKLFKSLSMASTSDATLIDQAHTFFDPFHRLPLEVVLHILEFVQLDIQQQVHPYVILELNSSIRQAALKTPSLWTNVAWSPKWPVRMTMTLKSTLPFVRHFAPCRLMLNFYRKHSRDLLQHIDFTYAPTMTSADISDYILALDECKDSLVTVRVRPDVPPEPTGIEHHGLKPMVKALSACIYQITQLKLMDIALESHRIKEIEFGVMFAGQLTRLLKAARAQGAKGTVPSLKRLSLHMASTQVPSMHRAEQIGPESALRSRRLGTIPLSPLLRGLEALKVIDRHGAHYDDGFFSTLKATLVELDWAVSCEATLQTEPATLDFPKLNQFRFKVLRQGPNRPRPPPTTTLKITWAVPACKTLSLPYDRLGTVVAPLATDVTVIFCGPVHEPRLLESFFLLQSPEIKNLTLDFAPELWLSLGRAGLEVALRDAVVALGILPTTGQHDRAKDPSLPYLCDLEELNIVAQHPHDSDELVDVEASLTSPFCLRGIPWTRDLYESEGPRVCANLIEVVVRKSPRLAKLRRERAQQDGKEPHQQQSAFRRSASSNATPAGSMDSDGEDAAPWKLKRLRIENFYMAVNSYETLRGLCELGGIELTVTPDPVAMASQSFAFDATGASRKAKLGERTVRMQ